MVLKAKSVPHSIEVSPQRLFQDPHEEFVEVPVILEFLEDSKVAFGASSISNPEGVLTRMLCYEDQTLPALELPGCPHTSVHFEAFQFLEELLL